MGRALVAKGNAAALIDLARGLALEGELVLPDLVESLPTRRCSDDASCLACK